MELNTLKNYIRSQILIPEMELLYAHYHQLKGGIFYGLTDEQVALFRQVFDPPEVLPSSGQNKYWRFLILLEDVLSRFQLGTEMIRQRLAQNVADSFIPQEIVELNDEVIPILFENLKNLRQEQNSQLNMLRFDSLIASVEMRYGALNAESKKGLLEYLVRGLLKKNIRYSLFLDPREVGNEAFEEAFAFFLVSIYVALFTTGNIDNMPYKRQDSIFADLSLSLRRHLKDRNISLWQSNQAYAQSFQPSTGQMQVQSIKAIQNLSDLPNWLRFSTPDLAKVFIQEVFVRFKTPYKPHKSSTGVSPQYSSSRSGASDPKPGSYHHLVIMVDPEQASRDELYPGMDIAIQPFQEVLMGTQRVQQRIEVAQILPTEPVYHLDELAEIKAQMSHHIARSNQLLIRPLPRYEVERMLQTCEHALLKGEKLDKTAWEAVALLVLTLLVGRDPKEPHRIYLTEGDRQLLNADKHFLQFALGEQLMRLPVHEPLVKNTPTKGIDEQVKDNLYLATTLTLDMELPKRAAEMLMSVLRIVRKQTDQEDPLVRLTLNGDNVVVRENLRQLLDKTLSPSSESALERVRRHAPAWFLRHFQKDTWAVKQLTGRDLSLSSTQLHYTTLTAAHLYEGYRRYIHDFWCELLPEASETAREAFVGSPHRPTEKALFSWLHAVANRLVMRLNEEPKKLKKVELVEILNLLNIYCERLVALSTGLRDVTNPYIYVSDIEPTGWAYIDDKHIRGGINARYVYLPPGLVGLLRRFEAFCHEALDVLIKRKAITKRELWKLKGQKGYERIPSNMGAPYLSKHGHFPGLFLVVYDAQKKHWKLQPYTRTLANVLILHPEHYIPDSHIRRLAKMHCKNIIKTATRFKSYKLDEQKTKVIDEKIEHIIGLTENMTWEKLHLNGAREHAALVTNANRHWLRSRFIELGVSPVHVDCYLGHVRLGTELTHSIGTSDGIRFREEVARAVKQLLGEAYPDARIRHRVQLINPFTRNPLVGTAGKTL